MPEATQTCPRCGRIEPVDADFCYCGFIFPKPGQRGSTPPMRAIPLATPVSRWRGRNLIWQFAQASLAAPLVSFAFSRLGRPLLVEEHTTTAIIVLLIVVWGLPLFGLVAAVIALAGVGKYGPKGLLLPGILGLFINGGVVAFVVYVLAHK